MKQFRTTQYLYDIEPTEISDMPYKEALKYKLSNAKELIHTLHMSEFDYRDEERIREVFDAIELTEYLIRELR